MLSGPTYHPIPKLRGKAWAQLYEEAAHKISAQTTQQASNKNEATCLEESLQKVFLPRQ